MSMMGKKTMGPMDAKSKAIEELMAHLDMKDGKDLGEAIKPKGMGIEVAKVQSLGDGGDQSEPDGDEMPSMESEGEGGPKMSDEEMAELIEAIQSKLGA